MKTWELVSIILSALTAGMFYGPWVALSRSMKTFPPELFLAIVDRMNRNMAPVMTVLMPATLLSIVPVLLLSYRERPIVCYLNAIAFALFIVALLVTVVVEVPIVQQIVTWTASTLPDNWLQLRDRWMRFHLVRVGAGLTSLILLLVAAIF
ncbi:anthrone oxygenase family protein [Tunturiibacter gelidoferens]|uniref:DUF1772 domain-containing protein n=2 Tax=Tunturiibacter TaxID=3154218 RepID=A0A7Y9T3I5_9BACT|nr:anthrone oxygenase family protein [Edaphobacter lichenicola]MBB5338404.1 hypothetical protein [Edaphobacter lichenicola]NYF52347.1 hypothetical protein [Edaphobacter lichenicola]